MTRRLAPPRIPESLVGLFTSGDQSATILGDLQEEFFGIVSRSGMATARRWYWRQALWTVAHLTRDHIRRAPGETVAFAVGGFLLYAFVEGALQSSAAAAAIHWDVYSRLNVDAVVFWRAIDVLGRYVLPIMVGWSIGRIARGRAMLAVFSVCTMATLWMVSFYASWLMANLDLAHVHIPVLSIALSNHPAGPPHGPSVANTLHHLAFSFVHWWIPTTVLLSVGATMSRADASAQIVKREARQ